MSLGRQKATELVGQSDLNPRVTECQEGVGPCDSGHGESMEGLRKEGSVASLAWGVGLHLLPALRISHSRPRTLTGATSVQVQRETRYLSSAFTGSNRPHTSLEPTPKAAVFIFQHPRNAEVLALV